MVHAYEWVNFGREDAPAAERIEAKSKAAYPGEELGVTECRRLV